jgi:phosphoglycerate dehydrogenase-like enzyme
MSASSPPKVALAPAESPEWMREAIEAGGAALVDVAEAEVLVWGAPRSANELGSVLATCPQVTWVQLPWAGVEQYVELIDDQRTWTCGKGVYAEPVAEMALGLMLAGLRQIGPYAQRSTWTAQAGLNLRAGRVTILGGGGITEELVKLLTPFDCHITVVRRHPEPMDGVDEVLSFDQLHDALPGADVVVLALALTPETEQVIGADELAMMESHAWLINVARGRHVDTSALVDALQRGVIGGAGLDVTDPEPLPDGHPLWSFENCLITPHTGNTQAMAVPLLAERITANLRRWSHGEPLIGLVDPDLGY